MMRWLASIILLFTILCSPASAADAGWKRLTISATGSYCTRYIPSSIDQGRSAPAIIFLHGSGANPYNYHSYLEAAAEETGVVLILPKSIRFEGWGDPDDKRTINECMSIVGDEIRVDGQRLSMAGHSSGGAYGLRLVYASAGTYNAVFTLAAPFAGVVSIVDTRYTAPILMYWGFDDPNFLGGAPESYNAQWQRLGVPWIFEALLGYGHNDLPSEIINEGFAFITDQRRPPPPRPWRQGAALRSQSAR